MPASPPPLASLLPQLICPAMLDGAFADRHFDLDRAAEEQASLGWGGWFAVSGTAAETARRVERLVAASAELPLVAADMEHGAGQALSGLSTFPTAMAFGATDDPALSRALGEWTAYEALSVGVNWILAPVADVANNPLNPIIGPRSFGAEAGQVAAHAAAFVAGVQARGALACAKHFPGHGDTATDSHTALGVVGGSRERLARVEWPPFQAAVAQGVATIMSAHLAVPALGPSNVPATLSPAVMTELLRRDWGFRGLAVTDALFMGGLTQGSLDAAEAGVRAIAAGCDMLLMPPDRHRALAALRRAVEDGRLPEARVREAAGRVAAARARVRPAPGRPAGDPEALAQAVATRALTLAHGERGPWLGPDTLAIAVDDGAGPGPLATWTEAMAGAGVVHQVAVSPASEAATWAAIATRAGQGMRLAIGLFSPIRMSKDRSLMTEALVAPLRALSAAHPAVVASFSSPFLVSQLPGARAAVLAYGSSEAQVRCAVRALAEGGPYPGRLPVPLPERLDAVPNGAQEPPPGPGFA